MLFAQLTHAIGLNDVCDALRLHSGPLSALRGATGPSSNNLSHANKRRDAALAERLFWAVLDHLQKLSPGFAAGGRGAGPGGFQDGPGQRLTFSGTAFMAGVLIAARFPTGKPRYCLSVGRFGSY
jgi:hypothetical protein